MSKKVLFVCLGNTCRSPALADLLNQKAKKFLEKGVIKADSAAITKYNVGEDVDPLMRQVAMEKGVKLKKHKARLFTKDDISQYDLILGVTNDVCEMIRVQCDDLDEEKKIVMATHFSITYLDRDIVDPFSKEKGDYAEVFSQIETIIQEMLENKRFLGDYHQ